MRVIHEMKFVARLVSGVDEWSCPTCGRRVTLRRLPEPELIVLDPGDESAVHVGVIEPDSRAAAAAERYGLGPVQNIPRPPSPPAPDAADRRWLAEIGIDWDGDAAA
ncbi:hypothetical protein [Streptomyces rubellomurinus]|uniref:Uncharacterized protein n=2 Tax=Streptomyces TaxID=1883 RepID=A0A0F2TLC9_STRR3|nr:hypothetical protein [Streptomyces rubellomurinus]KJS55744.1 hypothetical protein VM98_11280 [Streptomyces rubellomurinus subsp. indigoferus]KJS62527.1 hypothetical protein VM95_07930 [Streptomyces rubellomurinus]